jgi:hypothetical protein
MVRPVLTCDYNGWNDAPEEEREWFDQHPEIWTPVASMGESRRLSKIGRWFDRAWLGRKAA